MRLGVERELTEFLAGAREADLWTELDEPGRRIVLPDDVKLRLGVDRLLTELLAGARDVDLWTELDEDGRRTVLLDDVELREGAVAARPLKEADEEEVEENFLTIFLTALSLFFSVVVEDLDVVLVRDGV